MQPQVVAVVGLGYVGIPVLNLCAEAGYRVVGADVNPDVVDSVAGGTHPFTGDALPDVTIDALKTVTTSNGDAAALADVVIVTVPTPVDSENQPEFSALRSALSDIREYVDDETLVVVESTIPPGTCENVLVPILEGDGVTVGENMYLAHAPERIDPSNEDWPLAEIPRVVGGVTDEGRDRAVAFYESILSADISPASAIEEAEASKIVENAFRDVNIAFVNELARTFDHYPIDVKEVIDLAATKPYGFMAFYPGAGVGGHCIPVDPYLLLNSEQYRDVAQPFLHKARAVNEQMPHYVAERTAELADELDLDQDGPPTATLFGAAFKPDIEDTRGSPYFTVRDRLVDAGFQTETYDPWVPEQSTVDSPYSGSDIVVLVTSHDIFSDLDFESLAESGVRGLVDGRNFFDPDRVLDAGLAYIGIGRGSRYPDR